MWISKKLYNHLVNIMGTNIRTLRMNNILLSQLAEIITEKEEPTKIDFPNSNVKGVDNMK